MKTYESNKNLLKGESETLQKLGITELNNYKSAMLQLLQLSKCNTAAKNYIKYLKNVVHASRLAKRAANLDCDISYISDLIAAKNNKDLKKIEKKIENSSLIKEEFEIEDALYR